MKKLGYLLVLVLLMSCTKNTNISNDDNSTQTGITQTQSLQIEESKELPAIQISPDIKKLNEEKKISFEDFNNQLKELNLKKNNEINQNNKLKEAEILLIQKEIDVLSLAKETIINKYMNQPIWDSTSDKWKLNEIMNSIQSLRGKIQEVNKKYQWKSQQIVENFNKEKQIIIDKRDQINKDFIQKLNVINQKNKSTQ